MRDRVLAKTVGYTGCIRSSSFVSFQCDRLCACHVTYLRCHFSSRNILAWSHAPTRFGCFSATHDTAVKQAQVVAEYWLTSSERVNQWQHPPLSLLLL